MYSVFHGGVLKGRFCLFTDAWIEIVLNYGSGVIMGPDIKPIKVTSPNLN
jgi:hypothetical protein